MAARGLAPDIVSCNRVFTVWNENTASRTQRACGECAKCLFTALMLAPGTSPSEIAEQYGGALLDRPDHVGAVRELWSDEQPFDCVGERHESAAAVAILADLPGWMDQQVVAALGDEARGVLEQLALCAPLGPAELVGASTDRDLEELERTLAAIGEEDGGALLEGMLARSNAPSLAWFVRTLVGMDRAAAQAAFSAFLNDRVETIIDQLTAHGVMEPSALYEPPFTRIDSGGPDALFDGRENVVAGIFETLDAINSGLYDEGTSLRVARGKSGGTMHCESV